MKFKKLQTPEWIHDSTTFNEHQLINSTKNQTRLDQILGTWTLESSMKASAFNTKIKTHFIMHLTCNSQYQGCALSDCSEIDNQVCVMSSNSTPSCKNMNTTVVDWSDLVVFFYFGAKIDAGFPFNYHKKEGTGNWIGPYPVILAQNTNKTNYNTDDDTPITDSYTVKYVHSPSTQYLKMSHNCTLFRKKDFYDYFGAGAVNHTVYTQSAYNGNNSDIDKDNFAPYYKTCENGNVRSILPHIEIDFLEPSPSDDDDNETKPELVNLHINYKILSFPSKDKMMYRVFPQLVKKKKYQISGPYCYNDDPNCGYTIDLNYSSLDEDDSYFKLHQACVDDLPCLPPSVSSCVNCNIINSNDTDYNHHSSDDANSANGLMITLLLMLTLALIVSLFINVALFWKQRRQRRSRKKNNVSICNDTAQKCCRLEFEDMASHDEDTFHQLLFHNHGSI